MPQPYDRAFFDWVRLTALQSAREVLPFAAAAVRPMSVVDVGCGEGAWLSVWGGLGVDDLAGVDGDYVDRAALMIPPERFTAADLTRPFVLGRRFDLAQSLEVAEHLPPAAARCFVASLCSLSDCVLFSAAQPGQGGENHVNERPPSYWAALFREHGYAAFDCLRPGLRGRAAVAPWYRFNTILYVNERAQHRLAAEARATRRNDPGTLDGGGDIGWQVRKLLLRPLPVQLVSWLSRVRYRLACARQRRTGLAPS